MKGSKNKKISLTHRTFQFVNSMERSFSRVKSLSYKIVSRSGKYRIPLEYTPMINARTQFSVPCRQNINLYRLSQITFCFPPPKDLKGPMQFYPWRFLELPNGGSKNRGSIGIEDCMTTSRLSQNINIVW